MDSVRDQYLFKSITTDVKDWKYSESNIQSFRINHIDFDRPKTPRNAKEPKDQARKGFTNQRRHALSRSDHCSGDTAPASRNNHDAQRTVAKT
jgi:hypothetical protein